MEYSNNYINECLNITTNYPHIYSVLLGICLDELKVVLNNNYNANEVICTIRTNILYLQEQQNKQKQLEKEYISQIQILRNNNDIPEENICDICNEFEKNYTLQCGHKLCGICKLKLKVKLCPYCRKEF